MAKPTLSQLRADYQAAYDEYARAKREGPQKAIDKAHAALGKASARLDKAENPRKLPPLSPEQKRFQTNAKKLLRDVAAHVADGGESLTHTKVEIRFFDRRDRLEDLQRKLGLTEDPWAVDLFEQVRLAVRAMPEAASETRKRGYEAEIARLRRLEVESQAKLTNYDREIRAMGRQRRGG